MNSLDVIQYLAHAEAKHFAPLDPEGDALDIHDLDSLCIPRLIISRSRGTWSYDVSIEGHAHHDNEGRAPFVCAFLKSMVLNNIDKGIDVSGVYPLELHDSYTYLPKDASAYEGVLSFSKDMSHRHTIALPDPYQMGGYGGMLSSCAADDVPYEKKQSAILFAGTTTGDRDPAKNERIKACLWALNKDKSRYNFWITQVAQMSMEAMAQKIPRTSLDSILHTPVSREEHFKYKYILNIAGNTCCWSRVPMVLSSNSLLINLHHSDGTWYYPMLQDGTHLLSIPSLEALPDKLAFCDANPAYCRFLTQNAQAFVKNYCLPVHAAHYTRCLLEAMAANKA